MTETVTYTPTRDRLAYTFGGQPPVARLRPGDVLRVDTEDCFGGAVRGVDDLPSRVCQLPYVNPVSGPRRWATCATRTTRCSPPSRRRT